MPNIYDEYFEEFIPELNSRVNEFSNQFNVPNHRRGKPYLGYRTGVSNVQFYTEYTSRGYGQDYKGFIVGVYIDNSEYENKFNYLHTNKRIIEERLNKQLHWLNTGRAGRIFLWLDDDINNRENWLNIIKFQIDNLVEIVKVFKPFINELGNMPTPVINTINQNADTTIEETQMINKIQNIILYGSPGVGKTYNTKKLISFIESEVSENEIFETIKNNKHNDGVDANMIVDNISNRVKFITFHQSFGYEDFIEGFRPNENGDIKLQDGIFKIICDDANNNKEKNYYLVIDEINRGNISKIFGELITLIEEDKRDTLEVTLPYSKKPFKIPSNLYIIGTMNSTDKSIALIDIALRRRFTFLKMEPNVKLVDNVKAKNIMQQLNEKITETLGVDYVLGHSYFMKIENDDDLDFVLEYKIKPLLEEYFYGDSEGLKQILEMIDE